MWGPFFSHHLFPYWVCLPSFLAEVSEFLFAFRVFRIWGSNQKLKTDGMWKNCKFSWPPWLPGGTSFPWPLSSSFTSRMCYVPLVPIPLIRGPVDSIRRLPLPALDLQRPGWHPWNRQHLTFYSKIWAKLKKEKQEQTKDVCSVHIEPRENRISVAKMKPSPKVTAKFPSNPFFLIVVHCIVIAN